MNKKKHKSHFYKDKKKDKDKKKYYSNNFSPNKPGDKIRVVSTNVIKNDSEKKNEKKPISLNFFKKKDVRSNFNRPKRSNIITNKINPTVPRTIIPYTINTIEKTICPKCNKTIYEMSSTLEDKKTKKAAHFNCIFEEIKKDTFINKYQRLVYIGNGTFAVIEDINEKGRMKFIIKKRIQYTEK